MSGENSSSGIMTTVAGILYGQGVPEGGSLKNKVLGVICLQRPLVAIMGPFMFFAGAFLALRAIPSFGVLLMGFIGVYALTSAEHTIDDFIDKEIDKKNGPKDPSQPRSFQGWGLESMQFFWRHLV